MKTNRHAGSARRLRFLAGLTLLAWPLATLTSPGASVQAATGLVAGYAFSEGAGTTTADASGSGITGTLVSSPTWVAGKNGTGLSFNGSNTYVDLGNPAALQFTGSMTLSAWVYETVNVGDDGQIVAKSNGSSGWQLKSTPDTGPRTFAVAVTTSSGVPVQRYSTTVRALNTWYHVTGVYDAAALTLSIYVNGVLDNGVLSGTVPSSLRASPDNVNIGRRTGGFNIRGTIDDLRIYSRALSLAEIQADMNTPLGGGGGGDVTPPSVPTNLAATAVSSSQINLSWTASTDNVGVTGYQVLRNGSQVGTSATTTYSDLGLAPSTSYSYTVAAYDAAGNTSAPSAAANATTQAPAFDFSLASGGNRSVARGSSVTNAITATLIAGAAPSVSFAASGLPAGVTAGFSPSACSPTCSSTLTLTASASATLGTTTVTVTGTAGAVSRTTTFSLTVSSAPDTAAPTVSLTAPAANATVVGTAVTVSASASDNVGVAGVQFLLDGANLGAEDTSSPYSLSWNTTTATSGPHALSARARDAAGNSTLAANVAVTVDNQPPTGSVVINGGASATNSLSSTLTLSASDALGTVTQMRFSNTGTSYSAAEAYATTKAWTLSSGAGTKTVYVQFKDAPGNWSAAFTDTIVYDATAPTISSVAATGITSSSATIGWLTNEAATSQVEYGLTTSYGALTPLDPTLATSHNVALSGLASSTTFNYRARSRDAAGNERLGANGTFTTAPSGTPGAFQNEVLLTGFDLPTAIKFLPDGQALVLELGGTIRRVHTDDWHVDPVPFLVLTNIGTTAGQQGLMDMVLDPAFATNRYYYVFYTLGTPNHDRTSRFTATADLSGTVPGSEFVIYEDPSDANAEHHGGALNFGNDGKLYITTGEHFDPGAAQLLDSPRGKLLRFNKDGTVPTDNPFYDGAGSNVDAVWALGLRNPFRAFYDAPTGRLFIGDVGGNAYATAQEEVHLGSRGANYGWPSCEGFSCSGDPTYTNPIYAYAHAGRDAAITGGFVYRGTQFPAEYQGSYFFADYAQNWIKRLTLDANANVTGVYNFEPPDGAPDGPYGDIVYLCQGPDGALYYVDLGFSDVTGQTGISKIRRIRFVSNNQAPTAVASLQPTEGPAPLTVTFSSAGSSDPEGDPLTFLWTFGDGATSTAANPTHTYTSTGAFTARLSVSDGTSTSLSPPQTVSVGSRPVPMIVAPSSGLTFRAGDTISFSGDAVDAEDGVLGAAAFSWSIDFLHEGHVHPGLPQVGVKAGTFVIPTSGHDFSGNTRYQITLTVTDSDGLQASQSVLIFPEKVNLTFDSLPNGLSLTLDGIPHTTRFVYDTLVNFTHTVSAPDQTLGANAYSFASWSDGGTQQHAIVVPAAPQTYAATFNVIPNPLPSGLVAGYRFGEGSGTTTADLSGNNNTGTLVSGPTWTTGQYGNALAFNGTSYVNLGDTTSLRLTGSMTLSAWIRISAQPVDDGAIVAKLGPAGWQLKTSPDTGSRTAAIQISSNGSDSIQRYSNTVLVTNTWYHVAGVYDAAARTLSIYLNGVLDNGVLYGTVPAAQFNAPFAVNIGQRTGNPQLFNFRGTIDEVHVFNRALSAAEIDVDMRTPR